MRAPLTYPGAIRVVRADASEIARIVREAPPFRVGERHSILEGASYRLLRDMAIHERCRRYAHWWSRLLPWVLGRQAEDLSSDAWLVRLEAAYADLDRCREPLTHYALGGGGGR